MFAQKRTLFPSTIWHIWRKKNAELHRKYKVYHGDDYISIMYLLLTKKTTTTITVNIGNDDIHDVFSGWVYIYLIMKMSRKFIFILNLDFVFFRWTCELYQFQIGFDVFSINFKLIWTKKIHENKYDRWIITGSFLSFMKFVWKGNFLYPPFFWTVHLFLTNKEDTILDNYNQKT